MLARLLLLELLAVKGIARTDAAQVRGTLALRSVRRQAAALLLSLTPVLLHPSQISTHSRLPSVIHRCVGVVATRSRREHPRTLPYASTHLLPSFTARPAPRQTPRRCCSTAHESLATRTLQVNQEPPPVSICICARTSLHRAHVYSIW
jgi:hypothetical protein